MSERRSTARRILDRICGFCTCCCCPQSSEENVPLSIEETWPDSRTRPWGERELNTSFRTTQEPCNPAAPNIPEEDVHAPIEETQPDVRCTRSQDARHRNTSPPVHSPDLRDQGEDLPFSTEELDLNVINLRTQQLLLFGISPLALNPEGQNFHIMLLIQRCIAFRTSELRSQFCRHQS
ncbi:uncharacterized protein ACNLHF_025208 [Anomaloglossus baeobatrachus]